MTRERFLELAQAHGGLVARWPAAERDGAAALMAAEPVFAREALADAERLDTVLDAWAPMALSHDLREAVIATAPTAPPRRGLRAWILGAGVGAGLAGACAAGLAVGVALAGPATAVAGDTPEAVSAAMSDYDLTDSDESGA